MDWMGLPSGLAAVSEAAGTLLRPLLPTRIVDGKEIRRTTSRVLEDPSIKLISTYAFTSSSSVDIQDRITGEGARNDALSRQ